MGEKQICRKHQTNGVSVWKQSWKMVNIV